MSGIGLYLFQELQGYYYYYNGLIYLVFSFHFYAFSFLFSMKVLLRTYLLQNRDGVALLSLCLLILTRGPFLQLSTIKGAR